MNSTICQSICLAVAVLLSGCAAHSRGADLRQATKAVVSKYASTAEHRMVPYFEHAGVAYPPKNVAILAFKNERRVELWAKQQNQDAWHFIRNYPMTAYSGTVGPKLRAHDKQIPEGIYHIGFLYPYSAWHLSMKLDYPNQFDLQHARQDGRTALGGDIFIHGRASSVGCLAVGDPAIEELFVLVAKTGTNAAKVIIAPNDMRVHAPLLPSQPSWAPELTHKIAEELLPFQVKTQVA